MKLHLTLGRRLVLLVAIPLTGAVIFAGAIVLRLAWDAYTFNRLDTFVEFTTDLVGLRRSLAAEQLQTSNLYDDPNGRAALQSHVGQTEIVLAKLKAAASSEAAAKLYPADVRREIGELAAAVDQLSAARSFFLRQSVGGLRTAADAVAHRSEYREVIAKVVALIERLNQETDSAPLRSRLDGLVWFAQLAQAAEDERILYERGFLEERLTISSFNRLQSATAERLYFESNVVLMSQPELLAFWKALLAAPAYSRVQQLRGEVFNSSGPESHPFKAELRAEWMNAARDRTQILNKAEPHLLSELAGHLDKASANVWRQIKIAGALLAVVILTSLSIAAALIRKTNRHLNRALDGLNKGVDAIVEAVKESTERAKQLAQSASREAAGLQETGAALLTLTNVNQQNVDAANQTTDHMTETGVLVCNSRETMRSLSTTMSKISDSSHATYRIVKTINEISFQTSILALNASIEAASAGAAGTGFAVVAGEVRSLAKRASDATAETSRLVEESTAAVLRGSELTTEVEAALADLELNASGSAELMRNIHAASQQMLTHLQQINSGSRSMETVTQQNAAIADHNAETAETISIQTDQLQATIAELSSTLRAPPVAFGDPSLTSSSRDRRRALA